MTTTVGAAAPSRATLALYAVLGAIAPEIVLFYSKRFTATGLTFDVWQYVAATVLYLGLSAVVAGIFPYRGRATPWKAFAIGVGLPVLISGLSTIAAGNPVVPRGATAPGSLLDLLSFR